MDGRCGTQRAAGPRRSADDQDTWLPLARAAYRNDVPVEPGVTAHIELVVSADDTAIAARSGDVAVLATTRVVALCEEAANAAIGELADGQTSLGMRVQIDHLAPTAVGSKVAADARLEKIEGRRLIFSVAVNDDRGLVAAGKVTRVVVDRDRVLEPSS